MLSMLPGECGLEIILRRDDLCCVFILLIQRNSMVIMSGIMMVDLDVNEHD